jgi:hypothetical protein
MRDWDVLEREEKLNKKYRRIIKNAVYCIGGGIGLLIVQHFFPDMDGEGKAKALMNGLGFTILAYGLVMITVFVFLRAHVFKANFFLLFFVVPTLVIKLLVDTL